MRASRALVGLLCIFGCVAPDERDDDPGLSSAEQAEWDGSGWDADGEVIVIEGGGNGWDPGWWFPGPGQEGPVEPPGLPSGGGVGGGPGKQPARKDCTVETEHEQCYACCWYNLDQVDGWKCRKIKNPKKRERCWSEAEEELGRCQRACPRPSPVVTTRAP